MAQRDAQRLAYDAMALTASPTQLIRAHHAERMTDAQRALNERMARQATPAPPRNVDRATRANLWELDAPRDVAKAPDRACHHPLVKCSHKW